MEPITTGAIVGALSRLAPEVVKIIDARSERKHELAMARQNLEVAKAQAAGNLAITQAQGAAQYDVAAIAALTESIKDQGKQTGVKIIDGLGASVRPIVTYLLVLLYIFTKGQPDVPYWSAEDQALFGAVLNFWFLGRVLDKWRPRV